MFYQTLCKFLFLDTDLNRIKLNVAILGFFFQSTFVFGLLISPDFITYSLGCIIINNEYK